MNKQDDISILRRFLYSKNPTNQELVEFTPAITPLSKEDNIIHHKLGDYFHVDGEVYIIAMKFIVNLLSFKQEKIKETAEYIKYMDEIVKKFGYVTDYIVTKIILEIAIIHVNIVFQREFMNVIPKTLLETYRLIIQDTDKELSVKSKYLTNFFIHGLNEVEKLANEYNHIIMSDKLN